MPLAGDVAQCVGDVGLAPGRVVAVGGDQVPLVLVIVAHGGGVVDGRADQLPGRVVPRARNSSQGIRDRGHVGRRHRGDDPLPALLIVVFLGL